MKLLKIIALPIILAFSYNAPAKEINSVYELSFPNVEQENVNLSEFKGKVVLLNFWATWCPPCVKEMPSMQRLYEHFEGQGFEIVAINAGESSTAVSSFLLELDTELTFPILLDEKNRSFREFKLRGLPMSLLIGRDGEVAETILGGRDWDSQKSLEMIGNAIKQPAK